MITVLTSMVTGVFSSDAIFDVRGKLVAARSKAGSTRECMYLKKMNFVYFLKNTKKN